MYPRGQYMFREDRLFAAEGAWGDGWRFDATRRRDVTHRRGGGDNKIRLAVAVVLVVTISYAT